MHQKSFDEIKAVVSKETMLHHPNCELQLPMLPDASDMHLGYHVLQTKDKRINFTNVEEVLKRDHFPVLLHSLKLNNFQAKCTATEKDLLIIADALLDHRSILHGAKAHACSDQKNLTHLSAAYSSARAQRHMPLLEDLGSAVLRILGHKHELTGKLSKLPAK